MSHYCYILKNTGNKTYNGYTVNPHKRIRQHNQDLVGGAKYTRVNGNKDWEMYVLITGFPNMQNALQCEWRIKHPDGKKKLNNKFLTPKGRIIGLNQIFELEKWTNNTDIISENIILTLWITKDYSQYLDLTNIKSQILVNIVDNLDLDTLDIINKSND